MEGSNKDRYHLVAKSAGVSLATVYRVLNGRGRASRATADRIRQAARQLGVEGQRGGRTRLLAFLLGNRSLFHPFHSRILAGAEAYCVQHDYNLLILSLAYPKGAGWKQLQLPRVLQLHGVVDGFIVAGINSQNLLDLLAHTGLPFAVQGNSMWDPWRPDKCDTVYFDDSGGSRQVTRYLQSLGHRDIWFVGSRQLPSFERSYRGYEQAMMEAGLPPRSAGFEADQQREAGYLAMRSILNGAQPVTAVFAGSDPTAVGVYEALHESGRRVPDDISVAGFDDIEAGLLQPPLTTARIFLHQIGAKLAEFVLSRIERPELAPREVSIPTRLIRRDSCQPRGAEGPLGRRGISAAVAGHADSEVAPVLEEIKSGEDARRSRPVGCARVAIG